MKRRFELSASGIDESLVGMTSDPWSQGMPQSVGLRIPAVLPSDTGDVSKRPRYFFCLATRVAQKPFKVIGCRQGLTLGVDLSLITGEGLYQPLEFPVSTPDFKFPDGNVSWHIVLEKNSRPRNQKPQTDGTNWSFGWADGPAMLYDTFTNTVVGPTGAPLLYMENLTAYTPPKLSNTWKPIAGDLKSFYDIRFPQDSNQAWSAFGPEGINVDIGTRVSFYATVLQTRPASNYQLAPDPIPLGTPPEWAFVSSYTAESGGEVPVIVGPNYWRIFGSLIFEDEI
jgi:hypothetical protein